MTMEQLLNMLAVEALEAKNQGSPTQLEISKLELAITKTISRYLNRNHPHKQQEVRVYVH